MKQKVLYILIAGVILTPAIFVIILCGFHVREERSYTGAIYVNHAIVYDLLTSEFSWTLPDKSDRVVTRRLTEVTGYKLRFALQNDLSSMKGNCEGQAVVCCAVINSAFEQRGFVGCHAEPVLCTVWWYGINVNKFLQTVVPSKYKRFVNNHCIVKVRFMDGGFAYYDPTLLNGVISPLRSVNP